MIDGIKGGGVRVQCNVDHEKLDSYMTFCLTSRMVYSYYLFLALSYSYFFQNYFYFSYSSFILAR